MSAAENLQRLRAEHDEVKLHLAQHDRATADYQRIRALGEAARVAIAAGEEAPTGAPTGAELETAGANASIAPQVRLRIEAKVQACEVAVTKAEGALKDATRAYLRENALPLALAETETAFAQLGKALARVAAVHSLSERKFNSRPTPAMNGVDFYGPAAVILASLTGMPWEQYPYSVRPSWLPTGPLYPDALPAFHEHVTELRADIQREFPA